MMKLDNVEHKWVKGFEGSFSVTRDGRVYSHSRLVGGKGNTQRMIKGRYLKHSVLSSGYCQVSLSKTKLYVHRIVAGAYIPNPESLLTVNHISEDKEDNSADNLEWLSIQDNCEYSQAKSYMFVKDEVIHNVTNLNKFCRDNDLNTGAMSCVVKGTRRTHKGWTRF